MKEEREKLYCVEDYKEVPYRENPAVLSKQANENDSTPHCDTLSRFTTKFNNFLTPLKKPDMSGDCGSLDELYKKAENLFSKGDFEQAMVLLYSRGFSLNPELHIFKKGLWKAQAAIAKALGEGMDEPLQGTWNYTSRVTRQGDRIFMNESAIHVLKRENEDTRENCLEIDKFIQDRLDKWRDKSKFYKRTKADRKRAELENERKEKKMKIVAEVKSTVAELSEKLRYLYDLHEKRSEKVVEVGHCLLQLLYKTKHRILPNKLHYYFLIYNLLALSYISRGSYNRAKEFCEHLMETAVRTENNEYLCRAYCVTAKMHAAFGKFSWAIKNWERMIQLTQDRNLLAWAFHEMGRAYFELNKIDSALVYAGWSYELAKSCKDNAWCLNSLILLAHSNLRLGDNDEAMESFEEAMNLVTEQPTKEYITTCIQKIHNSIQLSELTTGLKCRRTTQLRVVGNPLVLIRSFDEIETNKVEKMYNSMCRRDVLNEEEDNNKLTDEQYCHPKNQHHIEDDFAGGNDEKLIIHQQQLSEDIIQEENEEQDLEDGSKERERFENLSDISEETNIIDEDSHIKDMDLRKSPEEFVCSTDEHTEIQKELASTHEQQDNTRPIKLKSPTLSMMDIPKNDTETARNAVSLGNMKRKDILDFMNSSRQQVECNIGDSKDNAILSKYKCKSACNIRIDKGKNNKGKIKSNIHSKRKSQIKIGRFSSWENIEKEKEKIKNTKERNVSMKPYSNEKFASKLKTVYLQNLKPKKSHTPPLITITDRRVSERTVKNKPATIPNKPVRKCSYEYPTKNEGVKKNNSKSISNLHPREWVNLIEVEDKDPVNENLNFCGCRIGLRKNTSKSKSPYARHSWRKKLQNCPCKRKHVVKHEEE